MSKNDLELELDSGLVEKLISCATNPRDQAFIAIIARTGIRISEAIGLTIDDIDFQKGTLRIVHLKQRVKLKCPDCQAILGKRHLFCPGCGRRVNQAMREKIEQRRQRVIPVDNATLILLNEYLKWRLKFTYRGQLVFPICRQRGWQLVERIGRRTGIKGLHPHTLRHLLATVWVSKGLDVKKLQLLLGHSSIATTMAYVDASLEQLKSEYQKLWDDKENETAKTTEKE